MESYFRKLPHEPWYVNRTRLYYSESFDEVYALAENLPRHSRLVQISEIPEETKRFIFFTLCEYMLVAIAKLMTAGQPPQQLAEGYREFQRGLLETSESMLSAVFRDNFLPLPKLTAALSVIKKKAERITTVRAYVEMDHKLILLLDYLLFYEEINRYEILLAPLLGGL
ncbi:hypothetical protein [Cohnella algarum]|uniref:hypothetical protein n=1 Tax=Cohnella algarum TaxID=2044859 RepID=UPI0019681989|nr:hypothetical protein [Cohnella algarum]MBN2984753.1 hypothetical protein [Cohnella algarum]